MLRVVLPGTIAGAISAALRVHAVASLNVGVAVEVVIVVDGDVVVGAPTATITPTATPKRTHHHADAKRNGHSRCVVAWRWVGDRWIRIRWRPVNHGRVITGNVDNLRVGLFDHDYGLALNDLRFYLYLLIRFQIAFVLGLRAHALDSVHDIFLLREEGVAQIRSPLNIVGKTFHNIRQSGQRLNARVPRLFGNRFGQSLVLEILIFPEPLLKLHDFQGIC